MKKFFALVFVLCFSLIYFGCGGGETPEVPEEPDEPQTPEVLLIKLNF